MNDDYLWDKSGKPDPDIQQLEEMLGALRYQPRELEIPPHVRPQIHPHIQSRRRSFIARGLAIAAAVALVVLGLGIWMSLNKQKPANSEKAVVGPVDEKKPSDLRAGVKTIDAPENVQSVPQNLPQNLPTVTPRRRFPLASNQPRQAETRRPALSESELAEARIAKDQLMLALRLASSKLNLAQKKTQGTNTENEIHNQHKAG